MTTEIWVRLGVIVLFTYVADAWGKREFQRLIDLQRRNSRELEAWISLHGRIRQSIGVRYAVTAWMTFELLRAFVVEAWE